MVGMLRNDRDDAQDRVKVARFAYRGELNNIMVEEDMHQLDPRYLDGLSSGVDALRSSPTVDDSSSESEDDGIAGRTSQS